jgi:HlyD family secretion protein
MKKFFRYFLLALLALLFIGTFVFLYRKSRPQEVRYQELEVVQTDIRRTTVVTGKIQPRDEVNIKPQINGIISELYKEAGQEVAANEVIAKLKVIPDMNSLSSAQSRLRLSEINLKQAQTNYEREKVLFDQKLVSADEYEKVLQALNQAKEESEQITADAQGRVETLEKRFEALKAAATNYKAEFSRILDQQATALRESNGLF